MNTLLLLILLLGTLSAIGSEKYKPSSRTTHQQKSNKIVKIDSREYYLEDELPSRGSPNRKVHPSVRRTPTPIPLYRQESTVGFSGQDWRSADAPTGLKGGGGDRSTPEEMPAQDLDAQVRGMQRLEGRQCCSRSETQRRPDWFIFLFGCCAGRR